MLNKLLHFSSAPIIQRKKLLLNNQRCCNESITAGSAQGRHSSHYTTRGANSRLNMQRKNDSRTLQYSKCLVEPSFPFVRLGFRSAETNLEQVTKLQRGRLWRLRRILKKALSLRFSTLTQPRSRAGRGTGEFLNRFQNKMMEYLWQVHKIVLWIF